MKNKLFNFKQAHEYILAGQSYTLCKIYLVHLSSNFVVKNEGEFDPDNNCYHTYGFTMFFKESFY